MNIAKELNFFAIGIFMSKEMCIINVTGTIYFLKCVCVPSHSVILTSYTISSFYNGSKAMVLGYLNQMIHFIEGIIYCSAYVFLM